MKFLKRLFGTAPKVGTSDKRWNPDSLTGEWQGQYFQHGTGHRIKATFTHDGGRISGQMTDVDTVTELPLYDAVSQAGMPPGADEQIAERIYQLLPDQAIGAITSRSVLPEASRLEGTVSERFVRFKKTYQGKSFHGYVMGDQGVGHATEGHAVEYSGQLSPDGTKISGRWIIYQPNVPRGLVEGSFELHRCG